MIEGLKPYSTYKDSGLRWIGRLPASWQLRRAKFLFREIDERSRTGREELLSVSHKTGVTPRSQKNITMFLAESNVGHKICRPDDLVINTLWAWMAALGVSRHQGIVSPAYGVYRPIAVEQLLPRFADQLLRTPAYAAEYQRRSTGVNSSRLRLYPEAFFRIPVLLPPLSEQVAIVRFLEHANRKIDGFIRAKRKLIGLLNEQKQVIIHRAVTRGFNPNAHLKPSGVPWIGDIPKHWGVAKLKHLTRFQNGLPFKPSDWKSEGIPIIRIQNLNGSNDFNYTNNKTLPPELLIGTGDLMFAWSGNKGTSFGPFQWDRPFAGYLNQHIFKLIGFKIPKRYFYYVLRAVTKHVEEQAGGIIGLVHVTKPELSSVQVPVASPEEQEQIAEHIDRETSHLNTVIARTEREIALMQEYRTRLTADIVTGKLDVRDANLPPLQTDYSLPPVEQEETTDDEEVSENVL